MRYRTQKQESLKLQGSLEVIRRNRSPEAFEYISRTLSFTLEL